MPRGIARLRLPQQGLLRVVSQVIIHCQELDRAQRIGFDLPPGRSFRLRSGTPPTHLHQHRVAMTMTWITPMKTHLLVSLAILSLFTASQRRRRGR